MLSSDEQYSTVKSVVIDKKPLYHWKKVTLIQS